MTTCNSTVSRALHNVPQLRARLFSCAGARKIKSYTSMLITQRKENRANNVII